MRQVVITGRGTPEVLQSREVADPVPNDGEVRIAVRAAGVNFADIMARLGLYPDAPPLPLVPGYEVSGVVDAVGPGVMTPRVGDRALALTPFGGYASAVVTSAELVFPPPPDFSDVEAAAVPVNYLTALIALYRLANLEANETVLIYGAGGGVGIAATQLAKRRGAVVIGTASTPKIAAIRTLGVDHPIDHQQDDVPGEVRRLTSGRGVDVILDPLGGSSFAASYRLLAPLGRLILYGASSLASDERRRLWHVLWTLFQMPVFRPLSLMNQNRAVIGLNLGHLWDQTRQLHSAMDVLLPEMTAGRLRPVIAKTFPLERAADAHRYMQSRANVGKVVLVVEPGSHGDAHA